MNEFGVEMMIKMVRPVCGAFALLLALATPLAAHATPAADDQPGPADHALSARAMMDNAVPVSRIAPGQVQVVTSATRPAHAQLAGYQSAPLPDEDSQAPAEAVSTDPSVRPAFFSRKTTFKGDGFMRGSDIETDQAHRQKPSGGLSLNIPMQ